MDLFRKYLWKLSVIAFFLVVAIGLNHHR